MSAKEKSMSAKKQAKRQAKIRENKDEYEAYLKKDRERKATQRLNARMKMTKVQEQAY